MNAVDRGWFNGSRGHLDILTLGSGKRCDPWSAQLAGDRPDRLEIAVRSDGKSRFQDVHAERCQLVRHAQLLARIHRASGALLAIAQRRVEDQNIGRQGHKQHSIQLAIA